MKVEVVNETMVFKFPKIMRLKGTIYDGSTPVYAIWYDQYKGVLLSCGERCATEIEGYEEVGSVVITND